MHHLLSMTVVLCCIGQSCSKKTIQAIPCSSDIYYIIEEMPVYSGGYEALVQFIKENLRIPYHSETMPLEGLVYVTFQLGPDCKIYETKIVRRNYAHLNTLENSIDSLEASKLTRLMDEEALRVVRLIKYSSPGYQRGQAVCTTFTMPIHFGEKKE